MIVLLAFALVALFSPMIPAQTPVPQSPSSQDHELSQILADAGGSAADLIRGLEQYLKHYPAARQKSEIERALAKAAADADDNPRIILYGRSVLDDGRDEADKNADVNAGPSADDTRLLDRVIRALLDVDNPEQQKLALSYSRRYEEAIDGMRSKAPPAGHTAAKWPDELDLAMARALVLQARAQGNLGDTHGAVATAMKSWTTCPTAEGARETAVWLSKLDRTSEAIEYYADAFTLEDPRNTALDRAGDRAKLGQLYAMLQSPGTTLGDVILEAYDRTSSLLNERLAKLKSRDPNVDARSVDDFVLAAVAEGDPSLSLSSLKGQIVVMDFWATWCAPCRVQKPLIDKVMQRYANVKGVIFVPVNADEDSSPVRAFTKEQGWNADGYFESGLAHHLAVSQIPTVIILNSQGKVSSRLIGLIPDRFEDMLTARIDEARTDR